MKPKLILIAILLFAALFRFYGNNWDQGYHLHPDERFLVMVGTAMQIPQSFADYLNPAISLFNPANVGFTFFVYGAFPLIFAKLLAPFVMSDTYDTFNFFGRMLSGFADLLVVLLIYKMIHLFEKPYRLHASIKFLGAALYATAVLPIQLAHFFTVDTFLNLFLFASCYHILKFAYEKNIMYVILSALFFGLALASKVTAILFLPLLVLLPFTLQKQHISFSQIKKVLLLCTTFLLVSYLTLRVADPYLFQTQNFFDFSINTLFIQNLETLKGFNNPDAWYPPGVQWIHKTPIIFSLQNIILFGLGIPFFIFTSIGICIIFYRYPKTRLSGILIWCLFFFIYQSTQMSKTMRYFIVLYPFFAIVAAIGLHHVLHNLKQKIHNKLILHTSYFILLILLLSWPLSFMSIYTKHHSRVQASYFLYNILPNQSILLSEHWDDALPLRIPNTNKTFTIYELPVFGPDDQKKWIEMTTLLEKGDYLILSSNRGWGSIPTVPERYPLMTRFYEDLFAEKLAYKKIATFTSYPSLKYLGIPISFPDDLAEEAFTVYDHPKVMIFKNTKQQN